MKKKIKYLFVSLICSITFSLHAQDYATAIGIRGGPEFGFTIKHFITSVSVVEGLVDFRYKGTNFTALYEINNDNAFKQDRLNWYYGVGGHVGFYNYNPWEEGRSSTVVIGADGIIGIEYNFNEVPINVSIDWKPVINLIGAQSFVGDTGALSVRYYF